VIHRFHPLGIVATTMPVMMRAILVTVGIAGAAGKECAAYENNGRR
jgi:hypothetical protein